MKIYVRTLTNQTYTVETSQQDSIRTLKDQIWEIMGIPSWIHVLVYSGRILSNQSASLYDYNIITESTLNSVILFQMRWNCTIDFDIYGTTKTYNVTIQINSLVEDIKFKIQDQSGFLSDHIQFLFNEKILEDHIPIIKGYYNYVVLKIFYFY